MGCRGVLQIWILLSGYIDIIINATANTLHVTLSIFQQGPDENLQLMEQSTNRRCRVVHLKFTQDPKSPSSNHYDAILLFAKSGQVCDENKDDLDTVPPGSR